MAPHSDIIMDMDNSFKHIELKGNIFVDQEHESSQLTLTTTSWIGAVIVYIWQGRKTRPKEVN